MKRRSYLLLAALGLGTLCLVVAAIDDGKTYIDPARATAEDPDFAFQGEYIGETPDGAPWGLQLIALGDGKFGFTAYPGGLPGDGWDGSRESRVQGGGQRAENGGSVTLSVENGPFSRGTALKDGSLTLHSGEAETAWANLQRVGRRSPTLDREAPEGALVLFDGTDAAAWTGKADTLMEDGLLLPGVTSKETFQDFELHLEFRTPYKPGARGQGRGNSGFYAQGRYEVQILDSFGLEGEENECGGIYSVGRPRLNMCYPPLTWQTYDVNFTAARYDENGSKTADARLTVRHNGVLIHEDIVADHATTAAPLKEGPEPGPVFLQDHGNPVRFRNVWVVRK